MSDFFATAQTQNQAFRNAMDREPAAPGDGGPFEGLGQDTYAGWIARPGVGVNRAMIQAGRFAEDVWRGLTELDDTPAIEGQQRARDTWWEDFFSANETYWRSELERNTIDPATRSDAANLIGGISNTLGSFIAPTLALGPLGGRVANIGGATAAGVGFGRESQLRLESEGVSPDEALAGGMIEGGWMGAMGVLPVSIPGRLWQRAASGAALNAGAGVGMRASMNEYLNSINRPDLAERYPVFDAQAMTIDTVLGGTFGALFGRRPASVRPHSDERAGGEGEAQDDGALDPTPDPEGDAAFAPLLPETGEGFLDEARLYGNEEMYQEAYAYALIARDMGAADAENVLALLEEDASPADLDAGRAIANEIAQSYLERAIEPAREAAIVEADTRAERMALGVPEGPQSARWGRQAMADMARQAARDEPLNPGPPPEGVAFVPRPDDWESAAIFDDIGREIEDDLRARGLGDAADRMQAMREANPGLFDPDEPLFSMGARTGDGEGGPLRNAAWTPPEGVSLTERARKIVEMAVNGASNKWIAEEMDASVETIRNVLAQAKKKLGGEAPWDEGRSGVTSGINPRTGEMTASIDEIIRLRDKLRASGFRNAPGRIGIGRRSLNQTIATRLGLSADNVAARISQYEKAVREGRRAPVGEGDALYSMGTFYSAVERVISNSATARASGSQWWATISKAQGVKREELEWIGLEDFLKAREGQISREDVLAFVRENGVRVEETVLGNNERGVLPPLFSPEEQQQRLQLLEERDRLENERARLSTAYEGWKPLSQLARDMGFDDWNRPEVLEAFEAQPGRAVFRELDARLAEIQPEIARFSQLEGERASARRVGLANEQTKWSQYTLPGGENYRELLLRLPTRMSRAQEGIDAFEGRLTEYAQDKFSLTDQEAGDLALNAARGQMDAEQAAMVARDPRAQQLADELREAYTTRKAEHAAGAQTFQSSHFAQANILAHVRFNERTDAQGRRTLFIEELQSDWHQAGRERGYEGRLPAGHSVIDTLNAVPDAPFKNNAWASLALKRMIRWAAENGFEQIAWTRGQHQIERFNISEYVDELTLITEASGNRYLFGRKNGNAVIGNKDAHTDAELQALIGKDLTEQLLAQPSKPSRSDTPGRTEQRLTNLENVEVGGSGMRAFYDKIMVNIANDLGKKFGARVDEAQVTADKEGWHITPPDQTVSGRWMVKSSDYNSQGLHFDTEAEATAALAEKQKGAQTTVHSLPITPEMREAAMEGQALFSQGGARASTPVEALKARAAEELGADWAALERVGAVEIVADASALPLAVPARAKAVHLRGRKKTYLIASAIDPSEVRGIILHEIGVHHGMPSMLGKRGWDEMLRQVDRMLDESHPAVADARQQAEAGATKANVREETIAYLVENHADLPLVQRILSRIRQWLIKTFGTTFGMRLTVDDIRALAVTSLRRVAEEARREAGEVTILAQASAEVAYPIDAYHGTMRPIVGPLRRSGSGALGPGFYVARNPKTTDVFAGTPRGVQRDGQFFIEYGSGANVLPLIVEGRLASKNAWDAALSREAERLRLDEQSSDVQYAAVSRLEQDGFAGVEDAERDFINIFDPARSIRSRISGEPFFSYGKGPDAGLRGEGQWRGSEPFWDDRLNAQQNKAVEMARNNYSNAEIAEEMDISGVHARNLLSQAKGRGVDVPASPRRNQGVGRYGAQPTVDLAHLQRLESQGLSHAQIAERTGLTENNIKQRLWQARQQPASGDELFSHGAPDGGTLAMRSGAGLNPGTEVAPPPPGPESIGNALNELRELGRELPNMSPEKQARAQEIAQEVYDLFVDMANWRETTRRLLAESGYDYATGQSTKLSVVLPEPTRPNGGALDTDFPLFSMGSQNRQNLVGVKRDPIESPDYQRSLQALRDAGESQRQDRAGSTEKREPGPVAGVGDEPAGRRERGPAGEVRARLRALVEHSGLQLSTKKTFVGDRGAIRAQIDTPFASEADAVLRSETKEEAKGGPTWIDFDFVDGSDPKEARLPGVHLRHTRVNDGARGARIGEWLYRQIVEWADRKGLPVYSDNLTVSPQAQAVYRRLANMGYVVERYGKSRLLDDGTRVSTDGQPVFVISKRGEIEEPLSGAPLPRDDYQIDGPTLRERQQRVDEARERQKAYDDASPAEQAIMDDPDKPLFSMGARKVSAREAMENARLEQETARRVALGAQAAAKCAARHGMGRASYIALNEVTPAVVAASVMGRALGLGMAIPIGITATPILARRAREDADPIGTAKTDAWWAAQEAGMTPPSNLSLVDYPDEVQGQSLAEVLDVDGLGLNEPARPAGPPPALDNPSRTLATDYQQPPAPFDGKLGFAPPDAAIEEEPDPARDLIDLFDPVIQSEPQE